MNPGPFEARFEARQAAVSPLPLVSVLVPAFNHAGFIENCLESIRTDGYLHREVILIDDGSSDDTYRLARAWLDRHQESFSRVLAVRQQNAGVCRTLNRLVSLAEGQYVTLLASDDALLPGGIERRVRALEERGEWLAVFGDAELVGPTGEHLASSAMEGLYQTDKRMLRDRRTMAAELVLRWCVSGPVLLLKRSAYDAVEGVGPYSEDLVVEDRDFYLRLIAAGRLGFVDQPVARYRVHSTNISRVPAHKPLLAAHLLLSDRRNLARFSGVGRAFLALTVARGSCYVRSKGGRGPRSHAYRVAYLGLELLARAILAAFRTRNAWASGAHSE